MRSRRRSTVLTATAAALALTLAGCTAERPADEASGGTTSGVTDQPSATGTSGGPPPAGTGSADPAAALDRALAELVAMPGGPPGAIAVVQIGDRRTVHTAGVADLDTGAAPTADQHMRVASAAKAFSGATALALVDRGVLSLDDTIGRRLPDLPAAWAGVTLRQLLSHTSGLPDFTRDPEFGAAVGASLETPLPPEQLLTFVADEPLAFPSGSRYAYDNSDNIAVGLMIQAATGKTYAEALQEQVLDPLGLSGTSLPVGVEMPDPVLHGYDLDPPDEPVDVTGLAAAGWAWASGGIVSTPADLNTFIRGYVGGLLFGAPTQAMQTDLFIPGGESGPPGPGANAASLALFRYTTTCGTVYGHTGNIPGYTQFAAASPDGSRSATVSMTLARNADGSPEELQVLGALRDAEERAVCLALTGS
ncbi:serine hydrolase domain-containing protein [Nakamurella deserti]|uniref:serine hydrolase domain-containing protein n=1 Tax=Nakamurella deserti TaxID=2164074 RepID=UPI000DBE0CAA|nr:serine hydrolase domain-containing protein [Nakamurella deserti]